MTEIDDLIAGMREDMETVRLALNESEQDVARLHQVIRDLSGQNTVLLSSLRSILDVRDYPSARTIVQTTLNIPYKRKPLDHEEL